MKPEPAQGSRCGLDTVEMTRMEKLLRNTPPEDLQPPPPGTLPALGDKAVKQIVEILESAADGSLPREEAVNTLVTVYGLPPEQAEAITPQKQKERTAGVEDAEAKPSKK